MNDHSESTAGERPGVRYVFIWMLAVIAVFIVVYGLVLASAQKIRVQNAQLESKLARGPRVLVEPALESASHKTLDLPATINGYIETPIYAKVAGYLKEIRVDKGARVHKDQILAVLESPELDKEVADAHANYWLQEVTDERNQRLFRAGVIAAQAADESHSAMLQAKAAYQQLLAMQSYEIVRAPVDGVITARFVDPGALIPQVTSPANGATPIVKLATLKPLRIYAWAPQSAALFIHDGDPATVTVTEYPGRNFTGKVTRHPEALNAESRTMLVEVDLPNNDLSLYPGMYARMRISTDRLKPAPTVPDDALIYRNNRVYVPVVQNNRLRLVQVTLGFDDGYRVEVTSGLQPNQMVAVNVSQSVENGEAVQPTRMKQ